MTDIQVGAKISNALKKELATIEGMEDRAKLRTLLVRLLSVTVEHVIQLAAIVRRLEELGDDLSDLEIGILPEIRKVAYGQIIPELLVGLQAYPRLLGRACSLPLPDQRRIAHAEPLKVMEPGGDHRLVPPLKLTPREISQVFGRGCIRDEAEQAAYLRDRIARSPAADETKELEVYIDRKHHGIVAGGVFISASDLAHYLSQLTSHQNKRRHPLSG